jgi:uncharacterized protein (TIGR00255 family)
MTGFGESHQREAEIAVSVEVRTINNRYFKLTVKCADGYGVLESEIEQTVREQIRRGTVQVGIRVERAATPDDYLIDKAVLGGYRRQLQALHAEWHVVEQVPLETLLGLPGAVIENPARTRDAEAQWPLIKKTLLAALANLAKMRIDEGRAMAADLRANCAAILAELASIDERAPLVADAYRKRLHERIQGTLAEYQVTLDPNDLIKDVAIFSDRGDISEETVRLRSHLEQFEKFMQAEESPGRKLEFLTQEMFREINTIGSKANDVAISRHVIEAKTAIERIREMIQNVE